ncbi:GerAB/ArcD/ProY family transporter [Paenibacillus arenilitoris]|uniref:Endospore germination permease n=1 Tax=Paenibacillus arenilitoris TaxID=2772299 RepID=A0A927H5B2_9BACL|nr:endospore germination permease [Paenibacillus arenilitoris]MBD2868353.1 endospore germination permease [Paenibacillus arenilitoris]
MSKYAGLNNAAISASQCAKIFFLFGLGSAALIVPTAVTAIAKQDAWISMLLVGPVNYLVMAVYLALAERFPNLSIAQYAERVIGTWAGKALTFTYILFFLLLSALVLRNISDFLGLSVLPQTPDWFIDVTFMIVVIYGVYLGIETIARTGEILFAWGLFVVLIILLSLLNQFELSQFEPLLYEGFERPIKGVYPVFGFPVCEFVFITVILPLVDKEERPKLKRYINWTVVLITVTGCLLTVFLIGVLGVSETARSPFAVYDMAKNINIEEILVRVEILVAIVWIGTVFMKLVLCVYVLAVLTGQMLNLSTYRPLVFPYSVLVIPLSLIAYRNSAHTNLFAMGVWTTYSAFQGLLLPSLLLAVAAIRGLRDNGGGMFPKLAQAGGNRGSEADKGQGEEPSPA